jgi:hypothetical protein
MSNMPPLCWLVAVHHLLLLLLLLLKGTHLLLTGSTCTHCAPLQAGDGSLRAIETAWPARRAWGEACTEAGCDVEIVRVRC